MTFSQNICVFYKQGLDTLDTFRYLRYLRYHRYMLRYISYLRFLPSTMRRVLFLKVSQNNLTIKATVSQKEL